MERTATAMERMQQSRLNQRTARAMRLHQQSASLRIMQIIQRKLLLAIAVAALAFSLPAADSRTLPVVNQKIAPGTLTGRIVFVDKSLHALAVEVKGKILQINVVSRVRVNKGGKLITFD